MCNRHAVRLQQKYFSLLINNPYSNIHLDVIGGMPKLQNSLSVGETNLNLENIHVKHLALKLAVNKIYYNAGNVKTGQFNVNQLQKTRPRLKHLISYPFLLWNGYSITMLCHKTMGSTWKAWPLTS